MMGGYVTASIWAWCEWTQQRNTKWMILTGVLAGCAILVKWLTGLLVFGGWGLWILLGKERSELSVWKSIALAALTCLAVFLPWQLYISQAFPAESAVSYAYNVKHILEDLGHPGDNLTHYHYMTTAYSGRWWTYFMLIGGIASFFILKNKRLSIAMLAMFVVVYAFFSFVVATKMPGLTIPVCTIGWCWVAIGLHSCLVQPFTWLFRSTRMLRSVEIGLILGLCPIVAYYTFQPKKIIAERQPDNAERNAQLHNTQIYQTLHQFVTPDQVILNCKDMEDTEVRFWQPNNAYHWYPTEQLVDSMLQVNVKLVAFKDHNNQSLPDYIRLNDRIPKLPGQLK
jgi:Dolichyl-phosphate-mannose-protein mannosyltransferase